MMWVKLNTTGPGPIADPWLNGKHAIVTGASRGIGAAVAARLASRGASITIMARSTEDLEEQATQLRNAHATRIAAVTCDVSREDSVREAFARAVAEHGAPHVLINNAGTAKAVTFLQTSYEVWRETLDVNLTGVFLCSQQVLPSMVAAASGRIVNIASTAGLRGYKMMSAYSASKHGVIGLTRSLALETAKLGVTVNAVCPGYVETGLVEQAIQNLMSARTISREEAKAMLLRPIPTGRFTTLEEVATAVEWLCSPDAANVTGIALPIAGGEVS